MKRQCTNTACQGDCETCNRAPAENPPVPCQYMPDEEALELAMMRIRNGTSSVDDARRVMCAYQCASGELQRIREECSVARAA